MRVILISSFLFLTNWCVGQQDYLLLHTGEKIMGTFRAKSAKHISYKIGRDRNKLPTEAVKEYQVKDRRYLVMKSHYTKTLKSYRVIVDGDVMLLRDVESNLSNVYSVDFVKMEGRLFPLDESFLSEDVWEVLSACENFREQFNQYKKNVLVLNVPRSRKRWKKMIAFYNARCLGEN
jgi:hypothetical protein